MGKKSKLRRAEKRQLKEDITEEDITIYVKGDGSMVMEVKGEQMATLPPEMVPWTSFKQAKLPDTAAGKAVSTPHDSMDPDEVTCWINSRYQVIKYENVPMLQDTGVSLSWLSIKRRDKESCHDWRDFQRIKNELCGDERFGLQVYPAESNLVDTSNQYHLWVFPEGMVCPIGFAQRLVGGGDRDTDLGSKQRPFEETPPDAKSTDELEEMSREIMKTKEVE